MHYLLSHELDNLLAWGAGSGGGHHPVISQIITTQASLQPERQHQIMPSTVKPVSLYCNVDPKCPVLILRHHETTTFLINPLYFTWSLYGSSTLYDKWKEKEIKTRIRPLQLG